MSDQKLTHLDEHGHARMVDVGAKPDTERIAIAKGEVRMQQSTLRLNKMGIKISEATRQPANSLQLTEVSIGELPPRVVTLARFPRDEFLSRPFSFTPELSIPSATM